jgi:hypothetical protein
MLKIDLFGSDSMQLLKSILIQSSCYVICSVESLRRGWHWWKLTDFRGLGDFPPNSGSNIEVLGSREERSLLEIGQMTRPLFE